MGVWDLLTGQTERPETSSYDWDPGGDPDDAPQRTTVWGFLTGQHGDATDGRSMARSGVMNDEDRVLDGAYHHEVGHAVALNRGGFTVTGMYADYEGGGRTGFKDKKGPLTQAQRRTLLLTAVAGQEAEIRRLMTKHGYSRKQALAETHHGAGGDRVVFAELAEGTGYTWEDFVPEARSMVKRREWTIERNAKLMARRGHHDGRLV